MYPKTVKDAATLILSEMSGRDKLLIRNTAKQDLIKFHFSFGGMIRQKCGLWDGNNDLIRDAGELHPDSVSSRIMEEVWEMIQQSG